MSETHEVCSGCEAEVPASLPFCINCGAHVPASNQPGSDSELAALIQTLRPAWLGAILPEAARQLVTKVLDEHDRKIALAPKDGKAWIAKAEVFLLDNRFADALHCYERALVFEPTSGTAWVGKGNALLGLMRYDSAVHALDEALAIESKAVAALIPKAYGLACLARYDEALGLIQEALDAINPLLGALNEPEARKKFASSLKLVFAWKLKAHILIASGQTDDAIAAFDSALSLDPSDAGASNNKIALLAFLGREDEARAAATGHGTAGRTTSVLAAAPEPMSRDFKGSGQQVSAPFKLSAGLARFQLAHSGRRNFSVWLLDGAGTRVALLANHIGPFNGSKALGINQAGTYLLNVAADGSWAVHVQQP